MDSGKIESTPPSNPRKRIGSEPSITKKPLINATQVPSEKPLANEILKEARGSIRIKKEGEIFKNVEIVHLTEKFFAKQIAAAGQKWYQKMLNVVSFGKLYQVKIPEGAHLEPNPDVRGIIEDIGLLISYVLKLDRHSTAIHATKAEIENFKKLLTNKAEYLIKLAESKNDNEIKQLQEQLNQIDAQLKSIGLKIHFTSTLGADVDFHFEATNLGNRIRAYASAIGSLLDKLASYGGTSVLVVSSISSTILNGLSIPFNAFLLHGELKRHRLLSEREEIAEEKLHSLVVKKRKGEQISQDEKLLRAMNKSILLAKDKYGRQLNLTTRISTIIAAIFTLGAAAVALAKFFGASIAIAIAITTPLGWMMSSIALGMVAGYGMYLAYKKVSKIYQERKYFNLFQEALSVKNNMIQVEDLSSDYKTIKANLEKQNKNISIQEVNDYILNASMRKLVRYNDEFAAFILLKMLQKEKSLPIEDKIFTNWLNSLNIVPKDVIGHYAQISTNDENYLEVESIARQEFKKFLFFSE